MSVSSKNVLLKKDKIDILFRKYALLKGEIHLQIKYFKNHVKNFQLIASPILAGAGYLLLNPQFAPADGNKFIWLVALFAMITATCYLIYDITDASYQILVLGERLAGIESKINVLAGQKLLIWESEISELFNASAHPFPGVMHPLWYMRYYGLFLLVGIIIVVPLWAAYALWEVATTNVNLVRAAIVAVAVYAVASAALALAVVKGIEGKLRAEARKVLAQC